MTKIDLFLDGDLATWFLERISPDTVGNVFVLNEKMAECARSLAANVVLANANEVSFEASRLGLSVHYPRILKPPLLARYQKIYNVHPGYLPYGRGFYPVFWALWEDSPAGATLHEINAGIDEGAIVAQTRVPYSEADTGGTLHACVRRAEQRLLMDAWEKLTRGETLNAQPQPPGIGTYHTRREFLDLKQRAAWKKLSAIQFVKLARCLSFPGYSGLELELAEKRFQVRLEEME